MGELDPSRSSSPASSPSREFSFAISRDNSFLLQEKTEVDLSPADDIFFHGHLLPLRLLSNLPSSVQPRDCSNSFTLPIAGDHILNDGPIQFPGPKKSAAVAPSKIPANTDERIEPVIWQNKKSKSFPLFGLQRRKEEADEDAEHEKQIKRKLRFKVGQLRLAFKSIVKPFSMFRLRTEDEVGYQSSGRKSNYWNSLGNITSKNNFRQEVMRRWRHASAPASMRASPTNSRILVADTPSPRAANDSTMEELQAAIQAAIAHCKNSIAKEEMKLEDSGN